MYFFIFLAVFIPVNALPSVSSTFFGLLLSHVIIFNLHPTPIIINMSSMMIANTTEVTLAVVKCKFLQK